MKPDSSILAVMGLDACPFVLPGTLGRCDNIAYYRLGSNAVSGHKQAFTSAIFGEGWTAPKLLPSAIAVN